jgi:arginase family enzyme
MNLKTSHTTFMRRLNEQVKPRSIIEIGTRAVCKEELAYAKKVGINYFTANQIRSEGVETTIKKVNSLIGNVKQIYLTVDLDVLDPAFVSAVQNPEPNGLCSPMFYDLLNGLCDSRVAAFDVVEVAPNYDNGNSAVQAARTIFEMLCHIEKVKKKRA